LLGGFLSSSMKGSSVTFDRWGCRTRRFPSIRGRFIVDEWTFASTIFRWRWRNRKCI
jgi:hypothetical protein